MNYCINSSNKTANNSFIHLEGSIITEQIYKKQTHDIKNLNTFTVSYTNDFQSNIFNALIKSSNPTIEQIYTLFTISKEIQNIEYQCNESITQGISIIISIEEEFCLYNKNSKGIALIAIDLDGDLLFNYTGYHNEFETDNYSYRKMDSEYIVYRFLSK